MTLQDLTDKLNEYYKFDIKERTRKRKYVYARKVYSVIAREMGYTFEKIGAHIGLKHDAVLYHCRSIYSVEIKDKVIFNRVIKDFSLPIKEIDLDTKKAIMQAEAESKAIDNVSYISQKLIDSITGIVKEWDIESINDFINTRLEPYDKMMQAKTLRAAPVKVEPAVMRGAVSNPFLK